MQAPANSEQFVLPNSLYVCGFNDIMVSVTATLGGATGYPVTARYSVISDCAFAPPLLPPNTGTGSAAARAAVDHPSALLITLVVTMGATFATAGVALRTRRPHRPSTS